MSADKIGEIIGRVHWELVGPDGRIKSMGDALNALTQVGEQNLAERGTGFASPAAPTGMRLGSASTAVAKTGAGAAIVTKVTDGNQAFDALFPASALTGTGNNARRITFKTTYAAGKATFASPITEAVIVNDTIGTDTSTAAANTYARVLLVGIGSKGAADSLAVTWTWDVGVA
jgi:hypothetical protein